MAVLQSNGAELDTAKQQLRTSHDLIMAHLGSLQCADLAAYFEVEQEGWRDTFAQMLLNHEELHFKLLRPSSRSIPDYNNVWEEFQRMQLGPCSGSQEGSTLIRELADSNDGANHVMSAESTEEQAEAEYEAAVEAQYEIEVEDRGNNRLAPALTPFPEATIGTGSLPTPATGRREKRRLESVENESSHPSKRRPRRASSNIPTPTPPQEQSPMISQSPAHDNDGDEPEVHSGGSVSHTTRRTSCRNTQRHDLPKAPHNKKQAREKGSTARRAGQKVQTRLRPTKTYTETRPRKVQSGVVPIRSRKLKARVAPTETRHPQVSIVVQSTTIGNASDRYEELLASRDWLSDKVVCELAQTSDIYVRLALLMRSSGIADCLTALISAVTQTHLPYSKIKKELDGSDATVEAVRAAKGIQRVDGFSLLPCTQSIFSKVLLAECADLVQNGTRLTPQQLNEVAHSFNLSRETVRGHRSIGNGALELVRRHSGLLIFLAVAPMLESVLLPQCPVVPFSELPSFKNSGDVALINRILGGEWAPRACFVGQRILRDVILASTADLSHWESLNRSLRCLGEDESCSCEYDKPMGLLGMMKGCAIAGELA